MSPFLVLAALLPAALLLLRVYRLDRIEKEPASVLWALLGCGAAAALLAYLLETLLTALLDCWLVRGSMAYLAAENFLVIACTEELCKRLPVRHIFWRHRAFDYRFDAVVYCVFRCARKRALRRRLRLPDGGHAGASVRAGPLFLCGLHGRLSGRGQVRGNARLAAAAAVLSAVQRRRPHPAARLLGF